MKRILFSTCLLASISFVAELRAQEASTGEEKKGDDRNVMLNAASANAGPRNVNIGLPASVGGTTVLENNLPVVYYYWPEMPYRNWRMDAMTNGVQLLDLGQTAVNIGDVGFSVGTLDNLGTSKFGGNVALNSNHFGLLNGSANISGPLNKKGLKFSLGAYVNYDPGTYSVKKNHIDRYFSDQMQMYKAALTQDYKFQGGSGSISLLYKFTDFKSMAMQEYAPYVYHKDGSVSQFEDFKIGSDNYIASQKFMVQDAATGKNVERDALNDYGTTAHTFDLIGKNKLDNGLNINYIVRYHQSKAGNYLPIMTGVTEDRVDYTDVNGNSGNGYLQSVMALASKKTPIRSLTSLFEVGKKSGKHDWSIGLNQWLYDIDKFTTEGVLYQQTVAINPQRVGDYNTGSIFEYHNGSENKTALFVKDKWDVSDVISLNYGARLEYQSLRGDYIDNKDRVANIPYLSNKKTKINKDWFNKAFMLNAVYKMTKNFGLLGEVAYNEQAGHLENYSAGNDPNLKKSKIPEGGFGIFYNHPLFNVVSKATYIKRDEYRATVNFTSPSGNAVSRAAVAYDIETVGWTTDIMANPFKGFKLHVLFTYQTPKYKNYSGTVNFDNGENTPYNFSDNYVTGVSKVLIEIDPSYEYKNLKVWASARYFSKEYANLTNSLTFNGRWETFLGANYQITKSLGVSATIVNLLNQRGAKGTISGADLWTKEYVENNEDKIENRVVSGTYIRPFTAEFGVKYSF